MFLRVSGYEIINFKEYLDIDFLNEKSVIYSKLKK